jgi:hypothetical protein
LYGSPRKNWDAPVPNGTSPPILTFQKLSAMIGATMGLTYLSTFPPEARAARHGHACLQPIHKARGFGRFVPDALANPSLRGLFFESSISRPRRQPCRAFAMHVRPRLRTGLPWRQATGPKSAPPVQTPAGTGSLHLRSRESTEWTLGGNFCLGRVVKVALR